MPTATICKSRCELLPGFTVRVIQGTGTLYEVYPVRRHGAIKRWPVRERIEFLYLIHRTGHHVHHTTGFDREEIIDLCIRINSNTRDFSGYVLAGVFGAPVSVSALVSVPAAVRGSCGRAGLPGGARSGGGSTGRVPRLTGPVLLPGRCLCWSVVIRWAGTG